MIEEGENFISGYFKYNQDTEIPPIFALWCGVAGVSCALGRRCYVDMGGVGSVFPNLYVTLVASSGRQRKSTAIGVIERILREMQPPPKLIAQKITPEALIESLKTEDLDGTMLKESSTGFVVVDELATFLNRSSYEIGLAALLIKFYDCVEAWSYNTKGGGEVHVRNACLGLLGGSTVDWIKQAIPPDAVGSGLTSRFIFVYVDKAMPPIPRPKMTDEKRKLFEQLKRAIARISTLEGPFVLDPEAEAMWDEEYCRFYTDSPLNEEASLRGYASRRGNHLLKLAMIFSASERSDRIITAKHLDGALALLTQSEQHMRLVMSLIMSSEGGANAAAVLGYIVQLGKVARPQLLGLLAHRLSSRELSEVIETLIHSGRIRSEQHGGHIVYFPSIALP